MLIPTWLTEIFDLYCYRRCFRRCL